MRKIITHDGVFHADEVLAIALIHVLVNERIPVERTRTISAEDINDRSVWIVDVGGQRNSQLNNYDHHQDGTLPASCMLILDELTAWGQCSYELYDELLNSFQTVSDIDCNGPTEMNGFQFNSLIKTFNALDNGFQIALDVAKNYIRACQATADKAVESRIIWNTGTVIEQQIRICDSFPIHWKRYNEEPFLVYPNAGKWNVLSIDSKNHPLVATGQEEFIHANKFIAVFQYKTDAIACAIQSI